jgi:lysozyme family protein
MTTQGPLLAGFFIGETMKQNFEPSLAFVLEYEGGYTDHPSDPGGATNLGITIAELARVRGHPVSKADVRALTREEAAGIYASRYWAPICGDELPAGVDLAVFDCAVNQGLGRAVPYLQMAAGVAADGHLGPMTLAAVKAAPADRLLLEFMARRMNAYGHLTSLFRTFGLGWSRRLMAAHAAALALTGAAETA